jgi:hypothetical protein
VRIINESSVLLLELLELLEGGVGLDFCTAIFLRTTLEGNEGVAGVCRGLARLQRVKVVGPTSLRTQASNDVLLEVLR